MRKITYGVWEGMPTILVETDDDVLGWVYNPDEKKWFNGSRSADVATKARKISKADFESLYSSAGFPANLPE